MDWVFTHNDTTVVEALTTGQSRLRVASHLSYVRMATSQGTRQLVQNWPWGAGGVPNAKGHKTIDSADYAFVVMQGAFRH
jgi:hypothetical protein